MHIQQQNLLMCCIIGKKTLLMRLLGKAGARNGIKNARRCRARKREKRPRKPVPSGSDIVELLTRFELVTSSLPRMRSTN